MKRTAHAVWTGALRDGKGFLTTASGALHDRPYSFKTRFEDETGKAGTNPEELIAAAHAGCFAMQLSHFLAEAGQPATKLSVDAEVTIGPGADVSRRLALQRLARPRLRAGDGGEDDAG